MMDYWAPVILAAVIGGAFYLLSYDMFVAMMLALIYMEITLRVGGGE